MTDTTPTDDQKEPQRRKQRAIPPVPLKRDWREELRGLKDMPDPLAVSLWRTLRNVWIWAETAPEKRKKMFGAPDLERLEAVAYGCLHAPHLLEPFGTFLFMLRAPAEVQAAQIAIACRQVYEWAEPRSLLLTAVHFAEAAGMVAPDDPVYANDAGWMCFRAALYERAKEWLERGYGLAVRMRHTNLSASRDQSIRALLRFGTMLQTLGQHEEAKNYFVRAARKATYTGRASLAAKANHDLLAFIAETGSYHEGEKFARQALDLYSRNAPRLPALAHDYGFLLVQSRFYTHAIPLLQLALSRNHIPEIQTLAWGTLAHAAGGARRTELYEEATTIALSRVTLHPEYAPGVFVQLAEGAHALREWDRAETYAAMAIEAARRRQQGLQEQDALSLLDRLAIRQPAQPEELPPNPDRIQLLTRRFKERLRKWRAPNSGEFGAQLEDEGAEITKD